MSRGRLGALYDRLPSILQDVALNVYGLRNRRRLRRWRSLLREVEPSERWSRSEQRGAVGSAVRSLLRHAVRYVPFYEGYGRLVGALGTDPAEALEVLRELPVVTRDEVLADPDAFRSSAFVGQRLARTVTSGTTGTPFTTWIEPEALLLSDALWWRRTAWAGFRPGDWIARLVGDLVIPLSDRHPRRAWRFSLTDRRLYLSTFHLGPETADGMMAVLNRRRPAFLMGYPSALDALVRLSMLRGIRRAGWTPKAVLYSSEPLHAHQRGVVEDFFGAPIRGLYGCAERIVSASECEEGSLHLGLIDGYVEGQFGETRPDGPSRITGLRNRAMPLIRFELGDRLAPLPGETCSCGRTLPRIDPVVTKAEDCVVTPSGRIVSPSVLTWAFKDLAGLERSRVIQRGRRELEILVQVSAEPFPAVRAVLEERVGAILHGEMTVKVRRVRSLTVLASGKSRFVVNDCPSAGGEPPSGL